MNKSTKSNKNKTSAKQKASVRAVTFIEALREEHNMSSEQAEKVLKTFLAVIEKGLIDERKVILNTVGVLTPAVSKAKRGINPYTLEKIDIPAKKTVKFSVSKPLKKKLNPDD